MYGNVFGGERHIVALQPLDDGARPVRFGGDDADVPVPERQEVLRGLFHVDRVVAHHRVRVQPREGAVDEDEGKFGADEFSQFLAVNFLVYGVYQDSRHADVGQLLQSCDLLFLRELRAVKQEAVVGLADVPLHAVDDVQHEFTAEIGEHQPDEFHGLFLLVVQFLLGLERDEGAFSLVPVNEVFRRKLLKRVLHRDAAHIEFHAKRVFGGQQKIRLRFMCIDYIIQIVFYDICLLLHSKRPLSRFCNLLYQVYYKIMKEARILPIFSKNES